MKCTCKTQYQLYIANRQSTTLVVSFPGVWGRDYNLSCNRLVADQLVLALFLRPRAHKNGRLE